MTGGHWKRWNRKEIVLLNPERHIKKMQNQARMVLAAIGITDAALRNDPTKN